MSEIHSLLCRWQEYFAVVELWFSLQMDRWDVFIRTKHTCGAFCSLQWSAFILPFPSLLPAIFIPGGEPCWTNGLLLSATHRFSVARIKDLPDIILSYMSLCQRSNETHNLMFHPTSLTSHFEFAATHSFIHFVWKEAAWHVSPHRLHQAGTLDAVLLWQMFCVCLFVLWKKNLFVYSSGKHSILSPPLKFLPHSIKMLKIFPLTRRTLGVFLICWEAEEKMLIWNILYYSGKIHMPINTHQQQQMNTHTTPLSMNAF